MPFFILLIVLVLLFGGWAVIKAFGIAILLVVGFIFLVLAVIVALAVFSQR